MEIPLKPSHLVLLVVSTAIFTLSLFCASSESDSDRAAELLALQARSKDAVIHFDDGSIRRFIDSAKIPRSYSILLFFDAAHLHDKPELHLPDLRSEFGVLASSFAFHNSGSPSASKLFFCEIEFKESQSTFAKFEVNSLPHIRLITPDVKAVKNSEKMGAGDFSRLADSMADFVQSRTKLTVGPIKRPPMFTKNQLAFFGLAILVWMPFAGKKILRGDTLLHNWKIWLAFSVFVYFFSVSGAMHNIIRKVPMYLTDPNDPFGMTFFYRGSGMQLGAEGFAVGSLYTIVGLLLALATHLLVKVRNPMVQRVAMGLGLAVSFWAVKKVVDLDNWKTGYGVRAYWPSSWK